MELGDILTIITRAAMSLTVLASISFVAYFFTRQESWGVFLRNSIIGLLIILALTLLVRAGKTQLAAYVTVGLFSIFLIFVSWDGAGVRGLAYSLLVLVVIGAGLFIGRQAGFITAILFILVGLCLMFAAQQGWLVNMDRPITDLSAWMITSVIFIISAYMIQIALNQIERAIVRAQHELEEHAAVDREVSRLNLELERRVTERTDELNASLERYRLRADEISLLHKLSNSLALGSDLYETLIALKSEIFNLFPVDAFYVGIYNEETDIIHYPIFFYRGVSSHTASRILKENPGLSGAVIFAKKALYLPDLMSAQAQANFQPINDQNMVLHTFLGVPLIVREKVTGLISVQNEKIDAYSVEQIQLVENIALQAALAIDKAMLLDELQRELTERKKLIHELESKNAELERFTYTVSHDLRSPLVTIKGFLGLLANDIQAGKMSRVNSDFKRIANATDKMDALLSGLLELTHIERIKHPLEKLNLNLLVQDAINTVETRLTQRKVKIALAAELPTVYANRIHMREVFENLFDNAAKYMGEQPAPEIWVGVRNQPEPVIFVADNGMGIEPKYQENIFGLFNKLNPNSEGTGIGLAIVKRIIETQGGSIWVESEGSEKGSTFCFTLPDPTQGIEEKPLNHSSTLL